MTLAMDASMLSSKCIRQHCLRGSLNALRLENFSHVLKCQLLAAMKKEEGGRKEKQMKSENARIEKIGLHSVGHKALIKVVAAGRGWSCELEVPLD